MELDIAKRIPKNIERLLKQSLPNEVSSRYIPYFMRLLSMKVSNPILDEKKIVKKIIKRVNLNKTERFKELYEKLCRSQSFTIRKEMLFLLLCIRENEILSILPLEMNKFLKRSVKLDANTLVERPPPSVTKLEKELLSDLLFILEGADGKYLKYSHLEDKYTIQSSYTLVATSKVLEEVSEVAYLYRKIMDYLKTDQVALINNALTSALRSEIQEYYRLIALLKQDPELNIKKVYYWVKEPTERMKWLAVLTEACETLRGPEIISAIFSYRTQANDSIKSLMEKILDSVSVSLMNMIEFWITEGDLLDLNQEFFIYKDDFASDSELWSSKFFINSKLVPSFFDEDLVTKIYMTGKSINFLKVCCKKGNLALCLKKRPKIYSLVDMKKWVEDIYEGINKELLEVLFEEYKLKQHFWFLKRLMLMGQGDFHHSLLDQLFEVLNDKAVKIYKHSLRTYLENAIRNSNFQYEDQEFLNLFDINLQNQQPLDVGWDVFSLDYLVNAPLSTIVTFWCSECYSKIFKFLFSVKRVEYMLNQFQYTRLFVSPKIDYLENLIYKLNCFRAALRYFINNFWAFLMIEGVESSWKDFYSSLIESGCLEDLIKNHYSFLENLIDKCLLKEIEIYSVIKKVVFYTTRTQEIQSWLVLLESSGSPFTDQLKEETVEKSSEISKLYKSFFIDVLGVLHFLESSEKPQLKYLASRLDYNSYYFKT